MSWAAKHADGNIRVNGLCPGAVWTSQVERWRPSGVWRGSSSCSIRTSARRRLMKRMAEIGYAALFLASDEASYATSANLTVDDGWTAL